MPSRELQLGRTPAIRNMLIHLSHTPSFRMASTPAAHRVRQFSLSLGALREKIVRKCQWIDGKRGHVHLSQTLAQSPPETSRVAGEQIIQTVSFRAQRGLPPPPTRRAGRSVFERARGPRDSVPHRIGAERGIPTHALRPQACAQSMRGKSTQQGKNSTPF
jgi:hypothetical protein